MDLLFILYDPGPPGFKQIANVVHATNVSKITNFSKRLKYRNLRKYNFVSLLNDKIIANFIKYYGDHMCIENANYSARFCFA